MAHVSEFKYLIEASIKLSTLMQKIILFSIFKQDIIKLPSYKMMEA